MADKSKSFKDNFVSKVAPDPSNVPETLLLTGYMGASSLPKHTRLYFDAQLSSYVEIPDDAILHTQDQPAEASALGGSFVWIKKDAVLTHKTGADNTKAKFLEGPIVQQFADAAAHAPVAQAHGITLSNCPSLNTVCITHLPNCGHTIHNQLCVTAFFPCHFTQGPAICPTQPVLCATHFPACAPSSPQVCASHIPACFPSSPHVCVTHTPVCFPTLAVHGCPTSPQLCITQVHLCPNPHTIADCGALTRIGCPTIPACPSVGICPTFGACPSIACGFPGGGGNPGF